MTQEQLAAAVGTTKATISRLESGDIAYTQDSLEALADALGTHAAVLLTRAPRPDEVEVPERPRKRA